MAFQRRRGEVLVLTFKEGLMSAMAHDLKVRVRRFEIDVDDAAPAVRATFDAASLEVVCAMRDGREVANVLTDAECRDIEGRIRDDVLHARRHPVVAFASTSVVGRQIAGRLTLHGATRDVSFAWREEGQLLVAEVRLDQRDFGIAPYRALMGAMKVRPEVLVRVRLEPSERSLA